MIFLIKLFGVLVMALGLAIFASPQFTQKIFDFIKEGKRIYYAGIIRSGIGLIILISSSHSAVPLAAIALGLMFLVSGIVVFASDPEELKVFISHYVELPEMIMRLLGLVAASFGILIFSIF